jgi:non-canonical purine NTP pyrophosphatase (RdgB/HAM1 family)
MLTLVTGNMGKLAEWRRLAAAQYDLDSVDIDLDEIQSLDGRAITADKARRAYKIVGKPVIVEDISAGLDILEGLPGPFIKFFQQKLGKNALYTLSNGGAAATVTCTACYYDGTNYIYGEGTVHGSAVQARGENGFGFDFCFAPHGQTMTYAEMTPAQKDAISHRRLAVDNLLAQLPPSTS